MILVLEFQQDHGLTDGRLGLLYSILSLSAIATMLAVAPRLQRLSLRASVPLSLASLAVAALALAVAAHLDARASPSCSSASATA